MDKYEPFLSLGLALVAGFVIGQERERSAPEQREKEGSFFGGSRTYPLVALAGAVCALLGRVVGPWMVLAGFAAVLALVAVSYAADVREGRSHGLTSEVAFLLTFLLGALALTPGLLEPARQRVLGVLGLAVVATLLLSSKPRLHALLARTSREDMSAAVQLLLVAVVVVPLLPDETYGPLHVLNPRQLGMLALLIASIGFAGYVAIQVLGSRRGLVVTGLIGGLVSSTAVTLAFSGKARQTPALASSCAVAVTLASSLMFARVLMEVAVVHPPLLSWLLWPMVGMGLTVLAAAVVFWQHSRRAAPETSEMRFANPFELGATLKFVALFAGVLLGAKAATEFLGERGAYLAGVLAGLTDVDAITLSMAKLARGGLDARVAATTVFLGAASNTLAKGILATVVGGWDFGRRVLLAFGATLAVGALALVAVWL